MQAYRVEMTVERDGTLALDKLPYAPGDRVEVIVLPAVGPALTKDRQYPLRGLPVTLLSPFEPVDNDDWSADVG